MNKFILSATIIVGLILGQGVYAQHYDNYQNSIDEGDRAKTNLYWFSSTMYSCAAKTGSVLDACYRVLHNFNIKFSEFMNLSQNDVNLIGNAPIDKVPNNNENSFNSGLKEYIQ